MDKKVGIFYGSATGTTAAVARKIAESLGVANTDIHDVAKSQPSDVAPYDLLVLGSSTWGRAILKMIGMILWTDLSLSRSRVRKLLCSVAAMRQ